MIARDLLFHDVLILNVISVEAQVIKAKIEHVYSRNFCDERHYNHKDDIIEFVGTPGSWGIVTLQEGERALVLLNYIQYSKRYFQKDIYGHFTIETINNIEHAIAYFSLVGSEDKYPNPPHYLLNSCFLPDENVEHRVAMPLALLERYLLELLSLSREELKNKVNRSEAYKVIKECL